MASQTPRITLIGIVLSLLALALIWQLPHWLQADTPNTTLLTNDDCLLNQHSCKAGFTDQGAERQVELNIDTSTIRSLMPLPFIATLSGLEAHKVTLVLEGKDMFMGINQVPMERQPNGNWQAITELAVCTTGRMTWLASLMIDRVNAPTIKATFEFEAQ